MAERRVPRIRFKGFEEDWEQRKLGEVFEEYSEKGHEELPPLTIAQGQGTIRRDESERTLQFDRESLSNYKVVHQNDFIVHLRSFEGGLEKANSLGIISPAYHTFHGVDTDSQFYYNYFRSRQFIHKELKPHVYGIRDGRSIDIEGMKTIRIPFTSLKEQSTIGSFILVLDSLLSLHQRKLEKLKILKKAMLEKMFPKNGAKVPEIRFSGFTDDWEQRKLGELVERVTRKNENMESTLALTISAQYGLIDQEEFFDKRIASKNIEGYFLIRKGEFAYNKSTSMDAPWGAVKRLDKYERGVLSTLYILFRILNEQQVDSEYLVSYYCTDLWHTEVQKIAAEGARNHGLLNIAPNDFFEMNLAAPKELQEQTKIGRLFQSLDSLLSLHQRKLEKLRQIKTSMLERMFV